MRLLSIVIALFMISGCATQKSAPPQPRAPSPPPRAPVLARMVDRAAATSRVIDHDTAPQPASVDGPVHEWQLTVLKKLQPFMRWPDDAPADVKSAAPLVRVTIDRRGDVLSARVVKSSGYESFDRAARKIFKRAAILPPPPAEMPGAAISF